MHKVLIVDDELLMRVGIRSMIDWEQYGYQVIGEAGNGKEGMDLALAASPDLIVTDIKMPVMDGLQFIREAKGKLKTCKYIILSNFDEIHYVKEALRLGAADYLIKSDITPASLTELLVSLSGKWQAEQEGQGLVPKMPHDYSLSLSHLKENFFKDLISGFINEQDAAVKAEELHIRVQSSGLLVLIMKVNQFESLKKKYVEKDEKLLRFSILNIMEEVIPSKWNKEMVIGSSSEYMVIVNAPPEHREARSEIEKLCSKILSSLRDFMNLSLTVGVSTTVPGFKFLRLAYKQAEEALKHRFFADTNHVLFYEDLVNEPARKTEAPLITPKEEQEIVKMWASKEKKQAERFLDAVGAELKALQLDEGSIRMKYILIMEQVNAFLLPAGKRPGFPSYGHCIYEIVLKGENWVEVHQRLLEYITHCLDSSSSPVRERTYTDLAVGLIHRYYAEDISLQSVANQINVNPSYLSRIFKQEKGENFISYLTRIRIEKAKVYLEEGDLKVYEVADIVGYHNYTYFSKIFKKTVGLTPEEYREQSHTPDKSQ